MATRKFAIGGPLADFSGKQRPTVFDSAGRAIVDVEIGEHTVLFLF